VAAAVLRRRILVLLWSVGAKYPPDLNQLKILAYDSDPKMTSLRLRIAFGLMCIELPVHFTLLEWTFRK
jgi:hypothetical protein